MYEATILYCMEAYNLNDVNEINHIGNTCPADPQGKFGQLSSF
jgi:hypothetical protein